MLIKAADDKSARLAELEAAMQGNGPDAKRAKDQFHILRAGIQGERDSAYFIDFHYGSSSRNWAVIHDLRLEHGGRVAQIDHVLINRFLEVYAIETKHFNSGVRITEGGEFERWNDYRKTYEGMESPLAQNERHIAVLRDAFRTLPLPERLGVRLQPSFASYVLVSNKARIVRPKTFDTNLVVKADQLKSRIDQELDGIGALKAVSVMAKLVSSDTVQELGLALARLHKPLSASAAPTRPAVAAPPAAEPVVSPHQTLPGPQCKACGKGNGSILYGKFGYYFKCAACEANTNMRPTCKPDHHPRLRKAGLVFYRECAECGSSEPFHANPA